MALFLAIPLIFGACQQDSETPADSEGQVRFNLAPLIEGGPNGRLASTVSDNLYLVIWIEGPDGKDYDVLFGDIYTINGQYISPTVKLPTGTNTITNFVIGDYEQDYDIVYAVPASDSDLAGFVDTTVDFDIEVASDAITDYNITLLGVEGANPEDFGFTTFNMDLVGISTFDIGIYAKDSTGIPQLTDAKFTMKVSGKTRYQKDLSAKIHQIPARDDWYLEDAEIVVEKPGYYSYTLYNPVGMLLEQGNIVRQLHLVKETE